MVGENKAKSGLEKLKKKKDTLGFKSKEKINSFTFSTRVLP